MFSINHSPAILILAAGASTRFGGCKQLARVENKTLLQQAIDNAKQLSDSVYVVLGARHPLIAPTLNGVNIVINPQWQAGMGGSIACGVQRVEQAGFSSVLLLLADQVCVRADHLATLLAAASPEHIVAARYRDVVGVPAIFPRAWFGRLKQLEGEQGAQDILRQSDGAVKSIELPEAVWDIDTQAELLLYRQRVGF